MMKAMVCERCGSYDLVRQDGLYVCQNCGTKYTVPEAGQTLDTAKANASEKMQKLLVLARRARDDDNNENAEKYYGLALQEDPDFWEAAFFQVYYQAMQCTIGHIAQAACSVANNLDNTFDLIAPLQDQGEINDALDTVISYAQSIASLLADAAYGHYKKHMQVTGVFGRCCGYVVAIASIHSALEAGIKAYFPQETERLLAVQKAENAFILQYAKFFNGRYRKAETDRLTAEIHAKDDSYTPPKGGCYVATAVYGSYDCPPVWTLRRFRDHTLAKTRRGRALIRAYYAVSPKLVKRFGKTGWFKRLWKPALDRLVCRLRRRGVADTPYLDQPW